MELPDEALSYHYQSLLVPSDEEWTPLAEMHAKHYLHPSRLKDIARRLEQTKGQVVAEREARGPTTDGQPQQGAFIDLPQNLLDGFRRKTEGSELGRILTRADRLCQDADRIVVLGSDAGVLGARAVFTALKSSYHNELPSESRLGVPRIYFEGDHLDNDALQELLDLIQVSCVDPQQRDERWAVVVVNPRGSSLEPAVGLRVFRRDAEEYYGHRSDWLRELLVGVTAAGSPLAQVFTADRRTGEDLLNVPETVGPRYGVLTAAGLFPMALMGLDVRAVLQGAAAMTKRFLEEPFERNPVLQFATVNYLMSEEVGKPFRILSLWSKKLEIFGQWYEQLVAGSLGKQGRGPTPLSVVQPRGLYSRAQQNQDGPRDRVITNLIVKNSRLVPIPVGMADRNEDDLNGFARKGYPDLTAASVTSANRAAAEVARPTADLIVPTLSEHTMGQLFQMLMLATVVEARLTGINPYSEPSGEAVRRNRLDALRG